MAFSTQPYHYTDAHYNKLIQNASRCIKGNGSSCGAKTSLTSLNGCLGQEPSLVALRLFKVKSFQSWF